MVTEMRNEHIDQKNKGTHPHKFTLWVGIASIIMTFAGLTSAFIVKKHAPGWSTTEVPVIFLYSTIIILASSVTVHLSLKAFKERNMLRYRSLITVTALLGLLFIVCQVIGFSQLWNTGITLEGSGAAQFLYIIFGLHALHVLGGAIALFVIFFRAYSSKVRRYNVVPVEVVSTYWHFVDALWIYLYIFFLINV